MSSEVEVVSRQGPFWVGVRVPVGLVKASTSVESDHLEHTVPRDTPLYAPDTRVVEPGQGGSSLKSHSLCYRHCEGSVQASRGPGLSQQDPFCEIQRADGLPLGSQW